MLADPHTDVFSRDESGRPVHAAGRALGEMKQVMAEISRDASAYLMNDIAGIVLLDSLLQVPVVIQKAYVGFASYSNPRLQDSSQEHFGLHLTVVPTNDASLESKIYFRRMDKVQAITRGLGCLDVSELVGKELFAHYTGSNSAVYALTLNKNSLSLTER